MYIVVLHKNKVATSAKYMVTKLHGHCLLVFSLKSKVLNNFLLFFFFLLTPDLVFQVSRIFSFCWSTNCNSVTKLE